MGGGFFIISYGRILENLMGMQTGGLIYPVGGGRDSWKDGGGWSIVVFKWVNNEISIYSTPQNVEFWELKERKKGKHAYF